MMALDLQKFLEEIQTPVDKFTISELQEREQLWRALWSWLDDEVKRFLLRIGTTVRIMQRNYRGKVGELGQVKFEPKSIEISVLEKSYNYNDGKYYFEKKVVTYPYQTLAWIEGIVESEPVTDEERYEVESLEEIEA